MNGYSIQIKYRSRKKRFDYYSRDDINFVLVRLELRLSCKDCKFSCRNSWQCHWTDMTQQQGCKTQEHCPGKLLKRKEKIKWLNHIKLKFFCMFTKTGGFDVNRKPLFMPFLFQPHQESYQVCWLAWVLFTGYTTSFGGKWLKKRNSPYIAALFKTYCFDDKYW